MTSAELRRMSSEQKEKLYSNIPKRVSTVPINSEKDDIKTVIDEYTKTEILLDDIPVIKKELSEMKA